MAGLCSWLVYKQTIFHVATSKRHRMAAKIAPPPPKKMEQVIRKIKKVSRENLSCKCFSRGEFIRNTKAAMASCGGHKARSPH